MHVFRARPAEEEEHKLGNAVLFRFRNANADLVAGHFDRLLAEDHARWELALDPAEVLLLLLLRRPDPLLTLSGISCGVRRQW